MLSVCVLLTVERRVGETATTSVTAKRRNVAASQGLRNVAVRLQGTATTYRGSNGGLVEPACTLSAAPSSAMTYVAKVSAF